MTPQQAVKYFVYALVVILSVIILVLVLVSPPNFADSKSVYQGF